MKDEKIIIIGGGIIGCSTAWMLKTLNPSLKVLILEKHNQIAHEHSFQSEGVFTTALNLPWNGYNLLNQAINDNTNPYISINPILFITLDFWIWACRFAYNSFFQFNKKIEGIYALAKRTNNIHKRLHNDSRWKYQHLYKNYMGKDFGIIEIYQDDKSFVEARKRREILNKKYGENLHLHAGIKLCEENEPYLDFYNNEELKNIKGCMSNDSEFYSAFNSKKFAKYLMKIAIEEGAEIRYQAEVEGFRIENKRVVAVKIKGGEEEVGDKIIICCGAHSRKIGRILGWTLPIWPVKGYSLNIEASGLSYSIAFMLDKPMIIGNMGNYYRVSSFIEFSTIRDKDVDPEKCQIILEQAQAVLELNDCDARSFWAFQRAVTVDDLPIIGKFPRLDNVFINAGHGARSSSLCLGSAELISHIALGQTPLIDAYPYSPNRFWI